MAKQDKSAGSDVLDFLNTSPPVAPATPAATATPSATAAPSDVHDFIAQPPPLAQPVTPPLVSAEASQFPDASLIPPLISNTAAGISRGLGQVGAVANAADAWVGRQIPAYARAEKWLHEQAPRVFVPGQEALDQQKAQNAALDAANPDSLAYQAGKLGGETIGTLPLGGPFGRVAAAGVERVLAPVTNALIRRGATAAADATAAGNPFAAEAATVSAANRAAGINQLGRAAAAGAAEGAGFNTATGGVSGDPESNPVVNATEGLVGGAALGTVGNLALRGAGRLWGGIQPGLENMAARLNIPLSTGELRGGAFKGFEDFSKVLPFSGEQRLSDMKNRAYVNVAATEMGVPGPVTNMTTEGLNVARRQVGQRIENAAQHIDIPFDNTLMNRLGQLETTASAEGANSAAYTTMQRLNTQLLDIASRNGGTIPGPIFQRSLREGSDFHGLLNSRNRDVRFAAEDVRDALIERGMNSSPGSAEAVQALREARRQYKAVRTVEPAINRTVGGSEEMSPQFLASQIRNNYDMARTGPGAEMQDMARVIMATKALPSSGTAERLARYEMWPKVTGGMAAAAGLGGAGASAVYNDPKYVEGAALTAVPAVVGGQLSRFGLPGWVPSAPRTLGGEAGDLLLRYGKYGMDRLRGKNALAPP